MEESFNYATSWLPSLFTNQTSWLRSQSLCHGTPCHLQIKIPKNGRDLRFLTLAAGISTAYSLSFPPPAASAKRLTYAKVSATGREPSGECLRFLFERTLASEKSATRASAAILFLQSRTEIDARDVRDGR